VLAQHFTYGSTFSSPRWTVAALADVRLAVAGRLCRLTGFLPLAGRVHAAAVADRRAAVRFDAHADRTNRCGVFWLGGCTRRSHRVARLVVGGVLRRAGRGDSHSEIGRTWFGTRFEATTWMLGDLVTTEAPTLAYKLATTTDHKVIGIMYLVASATRGMTAVDASSCGRPAQVPDGVHSSARPLLRMNRWGTWSRRCYQHPGERSCSQVARDD
jgi:hypothetical protein